MNAMETCLAIIDVLESMSNVHGIIEARYKLTALHDKFLEIAEEEMFSKMAIMELIEKNDLNTDTNMN